MVSVSTQINSRQHRRAPRGQTQPLIGPLLGRLGDLPA
jgi:hypothetical protein